MRANALPDEQAIVIHSHPTQADTPFKSISTNRGRKNKR